MIGFDFWWVFVTFAGINIANTSMATDEKIEYNLPHHIESTLTEDDHKVIRMWEDELITEISQLTFDQWDFYRAKSRGMNLPSTIVYEAWPKNKEDRLEFEALVRGLTPLFQLTGGVPITPEQTYEALVVSYAIGLLAIRWYDDIPRLKKIASTRTAQESTFIVAAMANCCCTLPTEEMCSQHTIAVDAEVYFAALPHAIPAMLRTIYAASVMHPHLLALHAAYVLAEKAREYKPQKNWWRAIYRVFHDRCFAIASCEAAFVSYMTSVFSPLLIINKALGVPDKLTHPQCLWKYTEKTDKPDVDSSPLSRSGTGNYVHYSDTPWREWKDDFGSLFLASVDDDEKAKQLKKQYGEVSLFKSMHAVAARLEELLNYTFGPAEINQT